MESYYFKEFQERFRFPKKKYNMDIFYFIKNTLGNLQKKSRILDAGCGDGALSKEFISLYDVYGIDNQIISILYCHKRYKDSKYIVCDINNLPFKNSLFDAILLSMVIEHCPNTLFCLKELRRVMKKGGKLLIITPNYGSLIWLLVENIWFRFLNKTCRPYDKKDHPSRYNYDKLKHDLMPFFVSYKINTITYGMTLTAECIK